MAREQREIDVRKADLLKQRVTGTIYRVFCFFFLLSAYVVPPLNAQSTTAEVVGTIDDQTGSVIPGAVVTIINTGTSETRKTTSAADGAYAFNLLPPGSYRTSNRSRRVQT